MPVEAEPQASEQYAPLQRMRYSAAQVMADEDKVNAYQQQNDFPELCRVQERGNWPAGVAICRQHDFLDLCPAALVWHSVVRAGGTRSIPLAAGGSPEA